MKSICIDIGNTRTKIWIFPEKEEITKKQLESLLVSNEPPLVCVAQSGQDRHDILALLRAHKVRAVHADARVSLPFAIAYDREKLGQDRLAALLGARKLYPGEDLLLLDLGTCLTVDWLVDTEGHLGGLISPGLSMRLKAMHQNTHALPLLGFAERELAQAPAAIGDHTVAAMKGGAYWGLVHELNGHVAGFKVRFPGGKVLFSGGDAHFFEKQIKSPIFAHPDLVMQGLAAIAEQYE